MTLDDENGVYLELVRGRLVRIVVPGFQRALVSSRLALDLFQHVNGPPDLAGEVLCPTDPPALINGKIHDYMEGAVRMLWILDPGDKSIAVHRLGAQPLRLREGDVLDGGDVVPGFRCEVGRIFNDSAT